MHSINHLLDRRGRARLGDSTNKRPKGGVSLPSGAGCHALLYVACILGGCATPAVQNPNGVAAREIDPSRVGAVSGVGIESRDYVSMTDQMIRDMLTNRTLAGRDKSPRIIIDSQYFKVGGSQAINRDLITERLRVNLNRAAHGRLSFIDRTHLDAVQQERDLKRQGVTDTGTVGMTHAIAGSDYLLRGAISSQDSRSASTGMTQRYNQISFEMVDVESSEIVWSGLYEFARVAADDVVYR